MLDYRFQFENTLSKGFVEKIVSEVYENPNDFKIVFELMFDAKEKVAWRAGWACSKISAKHPEWFCSSSFERIIQLAQSTNYHGLLRACLAIIFDLNRPDKYSGEFINNCFEWMISSKYPIAVQVYSMKIIYQFSEIEKDLKGELKAYLDEIDVLCYSKGFNSIRLKMLKDLEHR